MKIYAFILLFFFYYVECRKVVPINKNANIDFINMEAGMKPNNVRPTPVPVPIAPMKPVAPVPKPQSSPQPVPQPKSPPATIKPTVQYKPIPTQAPTLITPKPVNPAPVAQPISTPGPGTVKQLVTFYDSQGKASPIRPYSYSQAVKQG